MEGRFSMKVSDEEIREAVYRAQEKAREIMEAVAEATDNVQIPEKQVDPSFDVQEFGGFPSMRAFETGATRNVEVDPDYHGFFSPLSMHAYGDYMHRHRLQADGQLRDSDNWQKGIPNDAYVRSLTRHVHDVELIHDGFGALARKDDRDPDVLEAHLCAIIFNAQGMLYNLMKNRLEGEKENTDA